METYLDAPKKTAPEHWQEIDAFRSLQQGIGGDLCKLRKFVEGIDYQESKGSYGIRTLCQIGISALKDI